MVYKRIIIISMLLNLLFFGVSTFILSENTGLELDNQNNNKNQHAIPLTSNVIIGKWNYVTSQNIEHLAISVSGSYIAGVASDESNIHTIYLFFHDIPNPRGNPIIFGDDEDSNGEIKSVISFGNYYILFITVGLTILILINTRKTIFRKI
ncbi:MAG: hypothetical protein ACFE9M_10865 [Promethearchaeota archaeon]